MLTLKELVSKTLFHAKSAEDIKVKELAPVLEKYNFAVIRGVIDPEVIRNAKHLMRKSFDWKKDRPATGEHPSELHDNFQKLSIGGAEQSGVYRPRCMRTFYNPVWAEDIYGLRDAFKKMARVRNVIYGFPIEYAIDKVEEGFWTAARVHHYPAGAGFLISHKDNIVPTVQAAEGINRYFQPIMMMSKKGTGPDCDFEKGGGFFEVDNTRYYFEEECELGDIVIYSGATIHGVADIDIQRAFRQDSLDGRLCGFVTLYREFNRKGQLSDYLGKTEYE